MSGKISFNLMFILVLFFSFHLSCVQTSRIQKEDTGLTRERIDTFFTPPPKFVDNYGDYRSPLLFYNGDTVKSPEEWLIRKNEIKDTWMGLMGIWPPVIKGQKFEVFETTEKDTYTQYKVRFFWTPVEQTEGYLLIPRKKGKKPAVITVFYEPETAVGMGKKPNRDYALQLTKRGFVTLSLGTTQSSLDKTYSIYFPGIKYSTIQPISVLAYAAANAWQVLSTIDDVDSTRIGIVGHSFGGKWAMFASCLYDKFACAAWSDPGIVFDETKGSGVNYWEPWYLGYYPPPWENTWRKSGMVEGAKGLYPYLIENNYNLHELHALMAPRPFLVSGGSSDPIERWIPLNHTIAVNRLLGYKNRVAMTNRLKHEPNPDSNEAIYSFFEAYLKNSF